MELPKIDIQSIMNSNGNFLPNTLENFVYNAILMYGKRYDYTGVRYVCNKTPVNIKCNKCGSIFSITPYSHLRSCECRICYSGEKMFAINGNINHNNFYKYDKVKYINSGEKVEITCPDHGPFWQRPCDHLGIKKKGCPECGKIKKLKYEMQSRNTEEKFLAKANKKHKYFYSYGLMKYVDNDTPITITCSLHSNFDQIPKYHLIGTRCCPECNPARLKTKEEFEKEGNIVHDHKYGYDQVVYKGNKIKVTIWCKKCKKTFEQSPNRHLRGDGCSRCSHANYSKIALEWLEGIENNRNSDDNNNNNNNTRKIDIQKATSPEGEVKCDFLKYGAKSNIYQSYIKLDGCDSYYGTAYEFWGCYFHGCPKCFPNRDTITLNGFTHEQNYLKTLDKIRIIKEIGFELTQIWECDYKKSKM